MKKVSQSRKNVYDDVLDELESSYSEGKIDESSYQELKADYLKKKSEYEPNHYDVYSNTNKKLKFRVMGSLNHGAHRNHGGNRRR